MCDVVGSLFGPGTTKLRKNALGLTTLLSFSEMPASKLNPGAGRQSADADTVQIRPSPILAVLGNPRPSMKSAWMLCHKVRDTLSDTAIGSAPGTPRRS